MKNATTTAPEKQQEEEVTDVIFRRFKDDNSVIAIFPYLIEGMGNLCCSYQHLGQHSSADYQGLLEITNPVTVSEDEDVKDLRDELRRVGYNIRVIRRVNARNLRKARDIFRNRR